jgi:AraC-like DNA-binding protein
LPKAKLIGIEEGRYLNFFTMPSVSPATSQLGQNEINWLLLQPRLFWAYEGAVPNAYREAAVFFADHAAWLILQGGVRIGCENHLQEASAGQWVFPGKGRGTQHFLPDTRLLSIRFQVQWPTGQSLFQWPGVLALQPGEEPLLERVARRLIAATPATKAQENPYDGFQGMNLPLAKHLHLQEVFYQWLGTFADLLSKRQHLPWIPELEHAGVIRLLHFLQNCPLEQRVSCQDAAQLAGLSKAQLHRKFTALYGLSPHDVLEARRAEFAIKALSGNLMRSKEVASHLGFGSLSQFSSWFHRLHGCSPRQASNRAPQL